MIKSNDKNGDQNIAKTDMSAGVSREHPTQAVVQSLFGVYTPITQKVTGLLYFLHFVTLHSFIVIPVIIKTIRTLLLGVKCPDKAENRGRGKRFSHNCAFTVYTLVTQNVAG